MVNGNRLIQFQCQRDIVAVIFRTYRTGGDVIALMPYEQADYSGHCVCYQHIGQHGAADYLRVLQDTRPATEAEIAPLRRELEGAPYHYQFRVIRRRRR